MVQGTDAVIGSAYDARAAEYVELAGSIEQMDARDAAVIGAWRDATPGRLLDAGCDLVSSETRGREEGEISARPHGSLVAVR